MTFVFRYRPAGMRLRFPWPSFTAKPSDYRTVDILRAQGIMSLIGTKSGPEVSCDEGSEAAEVGSLRSSDLKHC